MKTYFKSLLLLSMLLFSALALADPPGRVGRIAYTQGAVSFRASYDEAPVAAELNWPVTTQNILSTASGARTEIRIGSTALRLDANSELEVTALDDEHLQLYLTQGSANIRIRSGEMARDFELQTPQGLVLLTEPSRLRIDAERRPGTTAVSLFGGAAHIETAASTYSLRAGHRIEITDGDVSVSDARAGDYTDEFDSWSAARDRRDDQSASVQYLSPEVTGYEELDHYGNWRVTADYGPVWYPRVVPVNWAPYRTGRWTWIEPWGWTWIDNAPWGYAPSHYGRWVSLNRRWCWVPGTRVARPVWAPALVGWVGGRDWNVAFSIGSVPAVGWFPLAPREVYVPSYRVSPTYVRQVNIAHVTNITNYNNLKPPADYRNRRLHDAVSVVPQERFVTSRTVVVAPSQAVLRQPQQLQTAPVSAIVPTAITRTPVATAPSRAREDGRRERDAVAPRTQPNLRQQQPGVTTAPPAALPPAGNSRMTVVPPGTPRVGLPNQQERRAAPAPAVPVPAPARTPRIQEPQHAPAAVQQAQPPQPVRPQPVVIQPAPATDAARMRPQERHEAAPAQVERRVQEQQHAPAPAPAPVQQVPPPRTSQPQPVVVQPAPPRAPAADAVRMRPQERREATPGQFERRVQEPQRAPTPAQQAQPPQPSQPQPVTIQPAPPRAPAADAARPRAQERRETAPARIERHDAAPAAPAQLERRVVPPAAPAARMPEPAKERREQEAQRPPARNDASEPRGRRPEIER